MTIHIPEWAAWLLAIVVLGPVVVRAICWLDSANNNWNSRQRDKKHRKEQAELDAFLTKGMSPGQRAEWVRESEERHARAHY